MLVYFIGIHINENTYKLMLNSIAAFSDNSITESNIRSNYRCYTCILYCNNDWTADDGGALRIYGDSSELKVPADARTKCSHHDISAPLRNRSLTLLTLPATTWSINCSVKAWRDVIVHSG